LPVTANELQTKAPLLRPLDWESKHFGVHAALLGEARLDDDALAAVLRQARSAGIQLLVWPACDGRIASGDLLDEFRGKLVDRKATFSRSLTTDSSDYDFSPKVGRTVVSYEAATVSPALLELALAAGAYSRFAVDPHIERERFEAMYGAWIERSVRKELADAVLVVPADDCYDDCLERPLGMISLSESGGTAGIGLVAVAASMRGQGIGAALMQAAHQWMRSRQARASRVVTQFSNAPACRLYERSGYSLSQVQHYYHFWPQQVPGLSGSRVDGRESNALHSAC
jgi:GNAT superfamily N-acetyltransferase